MSQNQRRRGRSGDPGSANGRGSTPELDADTDALAGLRQAVANLDPAAFARCFSHTGWIRVPRPEGDVILHGPDEIQQLGEELRRSLVDLTWTPSQRFVSAGQVVEEAVARARMVPEGRFGVPSDTADDTAEIRVPMRVVVALNPLGGIGSLTLWVDWAALHDPHGVDSARGAASALVAQARARDARGLQVIVSEPGSAPQPPPIAPIPNPRGQAPARPPAAALWWKQHRATLAGSVMALAAAAVIGWVAVNALRPLMDGTTTATVTAPEPTANTKGAAVDPQPSPSAKATGKNAASKPPKIVPEKPKSKPTVQAGDQYVLQSDFLFETASYDVTPEAQATLHLLARQIQQENRTGRVEINGYTDSTGSDATNLKLSRKRANSVASALQSELAQLSGIDVQLAPQAFGESDPVATNGTDAGREKNRRVTVVLPFRTQN